jgi:glycosyltransferase A (GT-A) superfamily protein (DUF2064 family)
MAEHLDFGIRQLMPRCLAQSTTAATVCLVIMLKRPADSKRRLAAEIGPRATLIAEHLCECALEDARAWPGPVCLAPARSSDQRWLLERGVDTELIIEQCAGNLGQRINHVDGALRALGYRSLLFIGTDCPALDADYLVRAATGLGRADVVLGPARDGGLVLMGTGPPWPDLSALPWSTPALGDALTRLCRQRGDRVGTLEALSDVDQASDLPAVGHHVARDSRAARRAFADWLARQPDLWRTPP